MELCGKLRLVNKQFKTASEMDAVWMHVLLPLNGLRELRVRGMYAERIVNEWQYGIVAKLPKLTKLFDLYIFSSFDRNAFARTHQLVPKLVSLRLRICAHACLHTNKVVFQHLTKLIFSITDNITSNNSFVFDKFWHTFPNLVEFTFGNRPQGDRSLDNDNFASLQKCKNLQKLYVFEVSPDGISALHQLEHLTYSNETQVDSQWQPVDEMLLSLHNLKSLDVQCSWKHLIDFTWLCNMPHLERLELPNLKLDQPLNVNQMPCLATLKFVYLCNVEFQPSLISTLGQCSALEEFGFNYLDFDGQKNAVDTLAVLVQVNKYPLLVAAMKQGGCYDELQTEASNCEV